MCVKLCCSWMREAIFHCDDSLCKHILLIVNSRQQPKQKKCWRKFKMVHIRATSGGGFFDLWLCLCFFMQWAFQGGNYLFFNYLASKCLLFELEIMSCMLLNMLIKHEKLLSCGNVSGKFKRKKDGPANLRLQIVRLSERRLKLE